MPEGVPVSEGLPVGVPVGVGEGVAVEVGVGEPTLASEIRTTTPV